HEIVDLLALLLREVAEWNVQADAATRVLLEIAEPRAEFRLVPRIDRALFEGERFVGNHAVHVEVDGVAEALAARAGAGRGIEAEENRFRLREFLEAGLALKLLVEAQALGRL